MLQVCFWVDCVVTEQFSRFFLIIHDGDAELIIHKEYIQQEQEVDAATGSIKSRQEEGTARPLSYMGKDHLFI